jgi:hypothetical protein
MELSDVPSGVASSSTSVPDAFTMLGISSQDISSVSDSPISLRNYHDGIGDRIEVFLDDYKYIVCKPTILKKNGKEIIRISGNYYGSSSCLGGRDSNGVLQNGIAYNPSTNTYGVMHLRINNIKDGVTEELISINLDFKSLESPIKEEFQMFLMDDIKYIETDTIQLSIGLRQLHRFNGELQICAFYFTKK